MAAVDITRVVTEVDAEGKAVFTSVGAPRSAEAGGMNIFNVCGRRFGDGRPRRGRQPAHLGRPVDRS